MTTAVGDIPIFFPVIESMDWATLQQALAVANAMAEQESAIAAESSPQEATEMPISPESASIAAEAESAYAAVASAPADLTAYMEYAFETARGSRQERLERLVVFAPTWWEASEIVQAFANERLLSGDLYNLLQKLQPSWIQAELGILSGKAEWLAAVGIEPVRVLLSPDIGPVDNDLLRQLPRLVEIGAVPSGPSFADRLGQMLAEDAKKRQAEYEARKRTQRDEWRRLDQLASRRRRRIRGERVEEDEDPREVEALLAFAMKRWSPEMIEWALYTTRVKILGVQVSLIIRNPLLSVGEKLERIADAKTGKISWCVFPVDPDATRSELAELREVLERVAMSATQLSFEIIPTSSLAGPCSLWDNLQLVESELHPIYQFLANIRIEFRLAEMWAEARRGPAEFRGRVEMVPDHQTGPVPLITTHDQRAIATFREAPVPRPPTPTDRPAQLAAARTATENARLALGDWQRIADSATKELAIAEVCFLIKEARRAERKLANPLPGRATGNRRRKAQARLPLLKAARNKKMAAHKERNAPIAKPSEKKRGRKKDRAA